jgi:hypothetical protein
MHRHPWVLIPSSVMHRHELWKAAVSPSLSNRSAVVSCEVQGSNSTLVNGVAARMEGWRIALHVGTRDTGMYSELVAGRIEGRNIIM